MKETLSKQLQDQIEREAASDASSYGYEPGHEIDEDLQSVYRCAAGKYATLYENAIARAERAEKALRQIQEHIQTSQVNEMGIAIIIAEALTTKTGEDE